MRVPPLVLATLLALPSLPGAAALAAQEPAQRADLERLRDSLDGVADSTSLLRLEHATIEVAKRDRDNPAIHLRLGFIAYRLGQLSDAKSHYDDAAGEFEWASELRPDWPYPWYGLGLSELAQGEHSAIAIENLRQQLGIDYLSKAAKAFARATQADPDFAAAAVDLANAALAQHIHPRLAVALQTLRLAAASDAGRVPAIQLARGRVEREMGEADSALVAFRAYLRAGGDSGVGDFELARTQFLTGHLAAAESSYYAGARLGTSDAARGLYRRDLSYLADSARLGAFDSLPDGAARARWLHRFWGHRDIAEAREPGERLAEHNRRWLYARRNFQLVSRHRHYDITEVYRSGQSEFDDRGIIYIRHGEPDERATFPSSFTSGLQPNISWLYHRPAGDLVFNFVARDDAADYKLVESLVDALGFRAAVRAAGSPDPQVIALYASREQFGGTYARIARGGTLAGNVLSQERADGRHDIATGTTTDSYVQRFPVSLQLVVSDFVVGAGADQAAGAPVAAVERVAPPAQALHVLVAIPADRLAPTAGGAGFLYPLQFRLFVSDESDSLISRVDTIRYFTTREPLRAPSYLSGRLDVALPPGRYRYRLLVATPDALTGQLVRRDSVLVPALDGRTFALSDVVMGRAGSGVEWLPRVREDSAEVVDTVLLNPLGRFPTDSVAELYYEVYGLSAGATYHTEIRLERNGGRSLFGRVAGLFGRHRPPVLLEFDAPAAGRVTLVHRGINLRGVAPGDYALTVTLTDPATGAQASRRQPLEVVAGP